MVKIHKVKLKNKRTGKIETRFRVGNKNRKFSPLFYTKTAAQRYRKKYG